MLRRPAAVLAAAFWLSGAAPSGARQTPPPAVPGAAQPGAGQQVRFEDLPPAIRLGLRAEAVRRATPLIPVVVLVSDPASYTEAIARWSPGARYPVLYDDGSALAHEDIARFVRAFMPERVVRYSAADEAALRKERAEDKPAPPWPEDAAGKQTAIDGAVLRAWGASTPAEFAARLSELKAIPPGVVIASPNDPAWTAALALAAGRAQPILWGTLEGDVNAELPLERAEKFCTVLESSCEQMGLPWRDLGDAIDAVTVCLNGPAKVSVGPDKVVAMTDLVGRRPVEGGGSRETGARWAWAGQIFGTESQASYRAACALFLSAGGAAGGRAWLFDGYPDSAPWNVFDAGRAAGFLRQSGWDPLVDDTPRNDRAQWMRRVSKPVDARLVLVNSKGFPDFFELDPGQCRPGDVPVLNVPAAVHFVHSWSAQWPPERTSVAGRWFERGAFAYVGSVQEPYLQAFVPTPAFAARMVSSCPWGAGARLDSGPAWKIAVFGDPLLTFGPPPPRSDAGLPLEAVRDVSEGLTPALKEKRFAQALGLLTLLGRDADAAKLAGAILADDPAAFTTEVAKAAVPALFRAGDAERVIGAFDHMGLTQAVDPWLADMLWLAATTRVESSPGRPDEKLVGALRANIRPDQPGADAVVLARAMSTLYGRDVALGMLRAAREKSTAVPDMQAADAEIARLSGR